MGLEYYIPPPLRPLARGVQQYLNPVEILREAQGSSGKFFGSLTDDKPGVDYGAGLDALFKTGEVVALPLSYGLSRTAQPMKAAFTELLSPLGATDDVVEAGIKGAQIPVDKTRRNLLLGIASLPVARSIPDILPKKAIKSSVDILKGNIKASAGLESKAYELANQSSELFRKSLMKAYDKKYEGRPPETFGIQSGPSKLEVESDNFGEILSEKSDEAFEQLKEIKNAIANSSIDDLRKLSDVELDRLNQMLYFEPNSRLGTGNALREKGVKEKLIKVLEERGRHKPFSFLDDLETEVVDGSNLIPNPINTDVIKQMVSGGEDFVPLELDSAQKKAYDFIGKNNKRIQPLLDPDIPVDVAIRRAGNIEDVPIDRERLKQIVYYLKTKPPEQLDLPLDVKTKTEAENFKEGFNIDAFHGTSVDVPIEKLPDDRGYVEGKDIAEFKEFVDQDKYIGDSPALADLGNWFSEDPKTASFFSEQTDPDTFKRGFVPTSRVIPVKLKLENPKIYQTYDELQEEFEDFMEDAISEAGGEIYEDTGTKAFRDMLKRAGHDGIVVTESRTDTGVIRKDFVIFDPKNIRSRFAKFDPKESESADISKKDGGLVSLTHVARDMFRGPRGISAFEQFIAKPQRPMVS